jgi:hypothetical protein
VTSPFAGILPERGITRAELLAFGFGKDKFESGVRQTEARYLNIREAGAEAGRAHVRLSDVLLPLG